MVWSLGFRFWLSVWYVRMYVCMHECLYVCLYACLFVCTWRSVCRRDVSIFSEEYLWGGGDMV